jgi:hypothetical protein
MTFNPHPDVTYTVGEADLTVSPMSFISKPPTDPLGFNQFTSSATVTHSLEFLSGSTWTAITSGNY